MNFFLLMVFSSFIMAADVQECLNDYNNGVLERNNANGTFKTAKTQKAEADNKVVKKDRKSYLEKSKESVIAALDQLAKSNAYIDSVKKNCKKEFADKANELYRKNLTSLGDFESFKSELELALKLL